MLPSFAPPRTKHARALLGIRSRRTVCTSLRHRPFSKRVLSRDRPAAAAPLHPGDQAARAAGEPRRRRLATARSAKRHARKADGRVHAYVAERVTYVQLT